MGTDARSTERLEQLRRDIEAMAAQHPTPDTEAWIDAGTGALVPLGGITTGAKPGLRPVPSVRNLGYERL